MNADVNEVLRRTNAARAGKGHDPLEPEAALMKVAQVRADAMARKGAISHTGWQAALRSAGIKIGRRACGENVAYGFTADRVVAAWMDSPDHRANILRGEFTTVGIAVASSKGGTRYWAQVFGGRR